jgi:hypothetical protein
MPSFYSTDGGEDSVGIKFRSSRPYMAVVAGLFLTVLAQVKAGAAIINAATAAYADVLTACNLAVDGDTVIVPAGTASWTSGITITKGITLIGQTTTNPVAKTANDQTIILDNCRLPSLSAPIFTLSPGAGKTCRVSGFTFQPGTVTSTNYNGMIVLKGPQSTSVRLDNCHIADGLHQIQIFRISSACYGVMDHNVFDFLSPGGASLMNITMGNWNNNTDNAGDGSFADPPFFGSEKFFFFEDNCINNTTTTYRTTDGDYGGRLVFRHNHCYNMQLDCHGTEARFRGMRAIEWYNNDFHWTTFTGQTGGLRSSTLLSYNNTYDGTNQNLGPSLQVFRSFFLFPGDPFLAASGDNPWDANDTEGNGTYVPGHSPHLYASGTVSGGSTTTLVDTTKNWTPNQWVGFTAKRVSDNGIAIITGNTSNTLTVMYRIVQGGGVTWTAGDSYQIHKVLAVMDQPGRGQCDLITGYNTPINSTTGTAIWPHQKLEPCYSWNDIYSPNGQQMNIQVPTYQTNFFKENRDYYNQNTAWTPGQPLTTGVGVGTLAQRPTQCTAGTDIAGGSNPPGVGYWATDTKTLYVCTATNTWTPYYTPYTYPHPLVSGATPTPAAPTNLRVTAP